MALSIAYLRTLSVYCSRSLSLSRRYSISYCARNDSQSHSLLQNALASHKDVTMVPFRVENCIFGDNFSAAQLDISQYFVDRKGNIRYAHWVTEDDVKHGDVGTIALDFRLLFSRGFNALEGYLAGASNVDINPDPVRIQRTCGTLMDFLDDAAFHEQCLQTLFAREILYSEGTETIIAALLANHLFAKLARDSPGGYFIANDTRGKVLYCPCAIKDCGKAIQYSGSGFGSIYLWHGKPDVVVTPAEAGGALNVVIPPKDKNIIIATENDEQFMEVKINSSSLRTKKAVRQIVAQAITFAFFQNKFQSGSGLCNQASSLIPTIAVCPESFDIYLYDTDNDILLRNEGDPIPFWKDDYDHLDISSILKLWMLINHSLMKQSLSKDIINLLSGSCGLRKHLDEKRLQMIDDTMTMQEYFVPSNIKEHKKLQYIQYFKYDRDK